ncbi:hypothetical protein DL765_007437 [Monosporascus sp. GIB2]|nr:hypothetical protein DL765_007437 [Monosporascus sp. GIB2]
MPHPDELEGFMINELGKYTNFKSGFSPKAFGEVTLIAKSNLQCLGPDVIRGGWGEAPTPTRKLPWSPVSPLIDMSHLAFRWTNCDDMKTCPKHFVCSGKESWADSLAFKFDFLLNMADMTSKFNLADYLSTLDVGKHLHQVGLPDKPIQNLKPQMLMTNGFSIGASHIGNDCKGLSMLKFAAERSCSLWSKRC